MPQRLGGELWQRRRRQRRQPQVLLGELVAHQEQTQTGTAPNRQTHRRRDRDRRTGAGIAETLQEPEHVRRR
ncbi:unnamed protein product [Callosobruchus maculatus]|uniref:Uncharacterized protein n=1 Tax=Callosobruchus maculatus TaxID=64391 RepID=A0A653D127_CALMS|nr:unnamed protein product [Callosobruchus maculatus]